MAKIRERLTYSNVLATLALFLAIGGGSFAFAALKKNSVKSKQIAAGAVKEPEIASGAVSTDKLANGAVTAAKLAPGTATQGPQGAQGPQGPEGPQGLSGASVFDASIPSGETVTGLFLLTEASLPTNGDGRATISFPVPAPIALTEADLGIGTASASGAAPTTSQIQAAAYTPQEDPACAGNAGAPSAPPGMLCVYVGGVIIINVASSSFRVFPGTATDSTTSFERRSGGLTRASASAAGDVDIRGTWAYTSP